MPMAEAKKPMPEDVPQIGFNILQANNIQKRMVFKSTAQIRNPRAEIDYKPKNTGVCRLGIPAQQKLSQQYLPPTRKFLSFFYPC